MVKVNPSLSNNIFSQVPDGVDVNRITRDQWNRMFVAEDMAEYKTSLAAKIFADVLGVKVEKVQNQTESQTQSESTEASKGKGKTIYFTPMDAEVEPQVEEREEVVAQSTFRR